MATAIGSITRKAKKGAYFLTEDEFFEDLVEFSGYADPETVKRVYNGMILLIFRELKIRGGISLPQLAEVFLSQAKERRIHNRNMAQAIVIPPHHQVRMVAKRPMKKFFKAFCAMNAGRAFDPAVLAGIEAPNSAIVE